MSDTGPRFRTPAEVRAIPNEQWEAWLRDPSSFPAGEFAPECRGVLDVIVRATRRRLARVELPPGARRLDVRATRAAFAAGTLGTVGDHSSGEDGEGNVVAGDADRDYPHDVQHGSESRWSEAERQAFLRRVQLVDRIQVSRTPGSSGTAVSSARGGQG